MPIELDIGVHFQGSAKNFLEVHLDQQQIQDLAREAGAFADIMASLQKIGKVFGLG